MSYVIYKATNLVNGKLYVGFTTKNLAVRQSQHEYSALKRKSKNRFHIAIRKHGIQNFVFASLKRGEDDEWGLKVEEPYHIGLWKPEYNMTFGGEGCNGHEYTKFTRQKQRVAKIGISNPAYGKPGTFLGKRHTEKSKRIIKEKRAKQIIPKDKKYGKMGSWDRINKTSKKICPHCSVQASAGNSKRWHFDNCKRRLI